MIVPEPQMVLSGSCHPQLARRIAAELGLKFGDVATSRFPDGEISARVPERVRGKQAIIVQPTPNPGEQHLMELYLLADACHRSGARSVTALIPYFGYARQDRRTKAGSPIPLRLVTDLLRAARVDHVIGVDVHCATIEAISSVPFEHLTALPLLLNAIRHGSVAGRVVVAPDLGATKLAQRIAKVLGTPAAFVHKERRTGLDVEVHGLTGEVAGRAPVIVDDMISTGGTIEAAAKTLLEAGCAPSLTIAATHGLFVGPALERLAQLPIERVIVTDSVPEVPAAGLRIERIALAPMLADAVRALHGGQSIELARSRA